MRHPKTKHEKEIGCCTKNRSGCIRCFCLHFKSSYFFSIFMSYSVDFCSKKTLIWSGENFKVKIKRRSFTSYMVLHWLSSQREKVAESHWHSFDIESIDHCLSQHVIKPISYMFHSCVSPPLAKKLRHRKIQLNSRVNCSFKRSSKGQSTHSRTFSAAGEAEQKFNLIN